MTKVLLYSGGTDSWLMDKLWKPDIRLYVNIHGMYSKEEMDRLPNDVVIAEFPLLGGFEEEGTAYVPMRNMYFLMIASNFGDHVCLGATGADTGTRDKDRKFLDLSQELFDHCLVGNSFTADRSVIIEKCFLNDGKYSLLQKFLHTGGKLEDFVHDTFACHHPVNGQACMMCKPCSKKFLLCYYYGHRYSKVDTDKMLYYLQTNVIPRTSKEKGTYFSEKPLDGPYALRALKMLYNDLGLKLEM